MKLNLHTALQQNHLLAPRLEQDPLTYISAADWSDAVRIARIPSMSKREIDAVCGAFNMPLIQTPQASDRCINPHHRSTLFPHKTDLNNLLWSIALGQEMIWEENRSHRVVFSIKKCVRCHLTLICVYFEWSWDERFDISSSQDAK